MRPKPIVGKMPVLIGLLALAMAGMWLLFRCSHPQSRVADEFYHPRGDTLTVAIEFSPLSYAYSGDTVTGLDYELLKNICRIHKVPVVFHPFAPLAEAFKGMENGKYDMVVGALPSTEQLKSKYPLTEPVYIDRQVLVERKSELDHTKNKTQIDLIGDTVWIAENSPYITRLSNMSKELGDSVYVRSLPNYSAEHLCILTARGKIPRCVVGEGLARRMSEKYPDLEYSTAISFNQFQTWAVNPKYPVLLDSLDNWITSFKKTVAYDSLLNKYF